MARRTYVVSTMIAFAYSKDVPHRSATAVCEEVMKKIGILDIYGFEVFEWNSFEPPGCGSRVECEIQGSCASTSRMRSFNSTSTLT